MKQITLLEFCQFPENRIMLMEHLIKDLDSQMEREGNFYICHIINRPQFAHIFKRKNNISVSIKEKCTGKSIDNSYSVKSYEVRLDQLLPELLKYKHYKDVSQEVWFYESSFENDGIKIRIAALKNAITDIKNNLT